MTIRNPRWLIEWLSIQRAWSRFADGVVLYWEAHGFITEKQYQAAICMYEGTEDSYGPPRPRTEK